MQFNSKKAAIICGYKLYDDFEEFSYLESDFYLFLKKHSLEVTNDYFKPAIKYLLKIIDKNEACKECKEIGKDPKYKLESDLCLQIIGRYINNKSLRILPLRQNKFGIEQIFKYPDIVIYGLALLDYSGSTILLLLYSLIKKDNNFTNEILDYLNKNFDLSILESLISDLKNLLKNSGLSSKEFKAGLYKLLVVNL